MPSVVNKSSSASSSQSSDIYYTISCVSHFAFPPVNLSWLKGLLYSLQFRDSKFFDPGILAAFYNPEAQDWWLPVRDLGIAKTC